MVQDLRHVAYGGGVEALGQAQHQVVVLRTVMARVERAGLAQRARFHHQQVAHVVHAEQQAVVPVRLERGVREDAIRVHLVLVRVQHPGRAVGGGLHHRLQRHVHQHVVMVEEGDPLAARGGDGGVGCPADAAVAGLGEDADARVRVLQPRQRARQLARAAGVVHDDELPVRIGLRLHRTHGGQEVGRRWAKQRHHHADQRGCGPRHLRRGDARAQRRQVAPCPGVVAVQREGVARQRRMGAPPYLRELDLQPVDVAQHRGKHALLAPGHERDLQRAAFELHRLRQQEEAEHRPSASLHPVRDRQPEAAARVGVDPERHVVAVQHGAHARDLGAATGHQHRAAALERASRGAGAHHPAADGAVVEPVHVAAQHRRRPRNLALEDAGARDLAAQVEAEGRASGFLHLQHVRLAVEEVRRQVELEAAREAGVAALHHVRPRPVAEHAAQGRAVHADQHAGGVAWRRKVDHPPAQPPARRNAVQVHADEGVGQELVRRRPEPQRDAAGRGGELARNCASLARGLGAGPAVRHRAILNVHAAQHRPLSAPCAARTVPGRRCRPGATPRQGAAAPASRSGRSERTQASRLPCAANGSGKSRTRSARSR